MGWFQRILGKPDRDYILKLMEKQDVDGLLRCLRSRNHVMQNMAAHALGDLANPRAMRPLLDALRGASWLRREPLLRALRMCGDKRAVPHLKQIRRPLAGNDKAEVTRLINALMYREPPKDELP